MKASTKRPPNTNYALDPAIVDRIPWFREQLLGWYTVYGRSFPWREPGRTAYEILVAEILLQRTTAARVAEAYPAFLALYPSWKELAEGGPEKLHQFLWPLGLWKQKAEIFHSLARSMEGRGGSLPTTRIELEQLPGVGQYIASAVLLIVHGVTEPLVDVNMARVLERFFGPRKLADIRFDSYLQTLARRVVEGELSLQVNWAILDLGALVCKVGQPQWHICPLQEKCIFFRAAK
jgi:A/G-specific adenine glycosylase